MRGIREVELHPETAAARGIAAGDWVAIETPEGSVRARARFNAGLDPRVVCGQHGWWQALQRAWRSRATTHLAQKGLT